MTKEMSRNYATTEQIFDALAKRDLDAFAQLVLARPLLLAEDEKRRLIAAAQAGDREAMNQVVSAKVAFAISIARQYAYEDVHMCELIEYAVRGLIDAVREYRLDESNEMSFIAFAAPMMRKSITTGITASKSRPLGGIKPLKISKTITERNTAESENVNEGTLIHLPLFLKDDYDHITEAGIMSSVCNLKELSDERVREKLSCLTDREREVMQMLIGYGCVSMSVNEVADHLLLLPSRIRQIRNKALKKMQSNEL